MAKLYFRYGAMNSGKSTALMQVAHNYEEQDKMRRTQHNKIFVASPRRIDLAEFYGQLQELAAAAEHNDEGVVQQLAKLIPTFPPTRQNLKL